MLNSAEMICGKLENVVAIGIEPWMTWKVPVDSAPSMDRLPQARSGPRGPVERTPSTRLSIAEERQIYGFAA
jgi:hypothetical protein